MTSRLIAFILIMMLSPVYLVLAVFILLFSGRPILFVQKRVGKDGKEFRMFKFRTMQVGSEKMQDALRVLNEANGPAFKIHNDPRLTQIGRFLFHTGLDELPQLFNVLQGDMELVGPRPLPIDEEKQIDHQYREQRRQVKPGLISPWILDGYHRLTFEEWMQSDCNYVKSKCLLRDLWLLSRGGVLLVRLVWNEVVAVLS